MNKVFFGKANDRRVVDELSYIHAEKEWFNGIDVGDYIFVKMQGENHSNEAMVNYLWKAKEWKTRGVEHELVFEQLYYFNRLCHTKWLIFS